MFILIGFVLDHLLAPFEIDFTLGMKFEYLKDTLNRGFFTYEKELERWLYFCIWTREDKNKVDWLKSSLMFSFGFKFLYFFRQQSLFMDEKGNSTVVVGIGSSYG